MPDLANGDFTNISGVMTRVRAKMYRMTRAELERGKSGTLGVFLNLCLSVFF